MFRLYELNKLLKMQAKLQGQGLPVPGWLSNKIADLEKKLQ